MDGRNITEDQIYNKSSKKPRKLKTKIGLSLGCLALALASQSDGRAANMQGSSDKPMIQEKENVSQEYANSSNMFYKSVPYTDKSVNSKESDSKTEIKDISMKELYNSRNFYEDYKQCLKNIQYKYRDLDHVLQMKTIGKSVQGRDIDAVIVGNRDSDIKIMINAMHHQKEGLTTILSLDQIERLLLMYSKNESYDGKSVKEMLANAQIWFVPVVNPDGIELFNNYRYNGVLPKGYNVQDVARENFRKVNLNRNYPAGFHHTSDSGPHAFSEPETRAFKRIHDKKNFDYAIAYHSAGEVIYWHYGQEGKLYDKSLKIARELNDVTGYPLAVATGKAMGAGYKDWLLNKKENPLPAVTIETGKGHVGSRNTYTLPFEQYYEIWKDNKDVPFELAEYFINKKGSNKYTTADLFPADVKVDGKSYTGNKFIMNGTTFVNLEEFKAYINGKDLSQNDLDRKDIFIKKDKLDNNTININDKKYVSLAQLAEKMGYHAFWDPDKQQIIIHKRLSSKSFNSL